MSLLLSEQNLLSNYKSDIKKNVSKIVVDGILNYGNLIEQLKKPRRGWVLCGIHPDIAEDSHEHSIQLVEAADAYCCNPTSDITNSVISPMLKVHDHIDAIFFDITPHDNISSENKQLMEDYGMNLLYSSLKNGFGHSMIAHYQQYTAKKIRESKVAFFLDKQDAHTKAVKLRNTFDDVRDYYLDNSDKQVFLFETFPQARDLEAALEMSFNSLNKFLPYNKQRFAESFMGEIADEVENYQGEDVYRMYNNLLSTFNLND